MLGRLNDAADDPSTKALLIEIDSIPFSFAQIEEILSTLDKARANGKKVVAYLDQDAGRPTCSPAVPTTVMNPAQQVMLVGPLQNSCTLERPSTSSEVEPQLRSVPSTRRG